MIDAVTQQRREALTVALLVVGYAGYYACRSDLSVCTPLILAEFKSIGFTKVSLGAITSFGTIMYALGKLAFGSLSISQPGRRLFLSGMVGAILCTVLFALIGPAAFMFAWAANRGVQSAGWVGMVKVVGQWFDARRYGGVMGVVSLSYLIGDFVSEWSLSQLIEWHWGWRSVFMVAAASLTLIYFANLLLLRERPTGAFDAVAATDTSRPASAWSAIRSMFSRRSFLIVCVLSFGFTFLRQTFNEWLPTFLTESAGMAPGQAGKISSIFPLVGAISVVSVGYLSDRLTRGGRAGVMFVGLLCAVIGLVSLARIPPMSNQYIYVVIVGFLALSILGPYSLLAGAMSLDIGGSTTGSVAAGWIDGIGYFGGILSGLGIATVVQQRGWSTAWSVLAIVGLVSCVLSLVLSSLRSDA